MRLQLILPVVNPSVIEPPTGCPHCGGTYLRLHQVVSKPLRDTVYSQAQAPDLVGGRPTDTNV